MKTHYIGIKEENKHKYADQNPKNSLNQLAIYATCYEQLIIKNGEMKNYIIGYQITFSLCAQQQYQILVMRYCKKHCIFDCLYCYYECQKKKNGYLIASAITDFVY